MAVSDYLAKATSEDVEQGNVVTTSLPTDDADILERGTIGSTHWDRYNDRFLNTPDHTHDSDYADILHDHDSDYADISHDHDSDYADISHDHDSDYADISHDHDSDYADISHTHDTTIVNTTRVTTSPYTVQSDDEVIFVDTDGGAITVNLLAGVEGKHLKIINCGSGGNDVTVDPNDTEQLYGAGAGIASTMSDGEVINIHYNSVEGWW